MKNRLKAWSILLVITLALFGAIPCGAMTVPSPLELSTMQELLIWYEGLTDSTLRECKVTESAVITGEVVLRETPCRVDLTFSSGLRIPSGTKLTVDNPNLALMGNPPVITVESGGILHIRRWNALCNEAMPYGGIVVNAGGKLKMESGVTLSDGLLLDQNPPSETLPPVTVQPPESAPEPNPGTDPNLKPEPPSAGKLPLQGEVLKVTESGELSARLTIPRVDPAATEAVTIERSRDALTWSAAYRFHWDENGQDFRSDEKTKFGSISGRTRSDGSKTDFQYLAALSGEPFYLRVIVTGTNGTEAVSETIQMTEPLAGNYPGGDDYEDFDGNGGGGGQGTSDREDQRAAASQRDRQPEGAPKIKTQTSAGTVQSGESSLPQTGADIPLTEISASQTAAKQPSGSTGISALPVQENLSGQMLPEKADALNSITRNWIVVIGTFTFCVGVWAIPRLIRFIKRKKS